MDHSPHVMKSVLRRPPSSLGGGSRSPDPPQLLTPDIPRYRFRRHMPHRPNVIARAPLTPLAEHCPQDWMLVEQHPRADPLQSLYDPDRRFRRLCSDEEMHMVCHHFQLLDFQAPRLRYRSHHGSQALLNDQGEFLAALRTRDNVIGDPVRRVPLSP